MSSGHSSGTTAPGRDPDRPFALRLAEPVDPSPESGTVTVVSLDGPWVQAFGVSVAFPLRSKSNLRRHRRDGERVWAHNAAFEQELKLRVEEVVPEGWELGDRDAKVASRPQIVAHVAAVTLIDAPNIDKSCLDALQGVVFHFDSSVRASSQQTVRRLADQTAWLGFARLDPDASTAEVAAAHVALLAEWAALGSPPFNVEP